MVEHENIREVSSKLRVTLIRSLIGCMRQHRLCVSGLGLSRVNQVVELIDNSTVRGLIGKIHYLLKVEKL